MYLFINSAVLCNIVQNAYDLPLLVLNIWRIFFLMYWKALCTAQRLDNKRHRSEEAMSNIP